MTPTYDPPWRQGRQVKRNIYDANDQPIAMMPDEATAALVVSSVNRKAGVPMCIHDVPLDKPCVHCRADEKRSFLDEPMSAPLTLEEMQRETDLCRAGVHGEALADAWDEGWAAYYDAFAAGFVDKTPNPYRDKTPGPVGGSADAAHGDTAGEAPSGSSDVDSAQPPTGAPATPAAKKHCFECGSPEHGASACPKVPGNLREHYRRTRGAIEFLEDATEAPATPPVEHRPDCAAINPPKDEPSPAAKPQPANVEQDSWEATEEEWERVREFNACAIPHWHPDGIELEFDVRRTVALIRALRGSPPIAPPVEPAVVASDGERIRKWYEEISGERWDDLTIDYARTFTELYEAAVTAGRSFERGQLEKLRGELAEANHWRKRHSDDYVASVAQSQANWRRANELESKLREAEAERDKCARLINDFSADIGKLQSQLSAATARAEEAELERDKVTQRLARARAVADDTLSVGELQTQTIKRLAEELAAAESARGAAVRERDDLYSEGLRQAVDFQERIRELESQLSDEGAANVALTARLYAAEAQLSEMRAVVEAAKAFRAWSPAPELLVSRQLRELCDAVDALTATETKGGEMEESGG